VKENQAGVISGAQSVMKSLFVQLLPVFVWSLSPALSSGFATYRSASLVTSKIRSRVLRSATVPFFYDKKNGTVALRSTSKHSEAYFRTRPLSAATFARKVWWYTVLNICPKTGHSTPTPQPHHTTFLANVLRYVRYMLSAVRLLSVVCLFVVCDVGAPYSGGWTFRKFFFTIR